MIEATPREKAFIEFLEGLERQGNRGALAKLRRCLGKASLTAEAMQVLQAFLSEDDATMKRFGLIASLFAAHPQSRDPSRDIGNFGSSFRMTGEHESAEKRFMALLDSDLDDLPSRLRQAVSLTRSRNVPVNWLQLLADLKRWDHPKRFIQNNWARSYWRPPEKTTETAAKGE